MNECIATSAYKFRENENNFDGKLLQREQKLIVERSGGILGSVSDKTCLE